MIMGKNINIDEHLGKLLIGAVVLGLSIIIFLNNSYVSVNEFQNYKESIDKADCRFETRLDKIENKIDKLTDIILKK